MTIKETAVIIEALKGAFPGRFSASKEDADSMLALWSSMFADYSYNDVRFAVKAFIASDTSGFPPSIGQIIAQIRKNNVPNDKSIGEAWELVRKAISNGIYGAKEEFEKLPPTVKRVVGGASQLRDWAMLDTKGLQFIESEFRKEYKYELEEERQQTALPKDVREYIELKDNYEPRSIGEIAKQIESERKGES